MKNKIWECKIGEIAASKLPKVADGPMRNAIQKAYHELTGEWADFIFSGWDAELSEAERNFLIETSPEE